MPLHQNQIKCQIYVHITITYTYISDLLPALSTPCTGNSDLLSLYCNLHFLMFQIYCHFTTILTYITDHLHHNLHIRSITTLAFRYIATIYFVHNSYFISDDYWYFTPTYTYMLLFIPELTHVTVLLHFKSIATFAILPVQ